MKHLNIKIYGDVQGVGFRYECKRKADELGVKGMVRNEPDGTVYVEAEADEDTLVKFVVWCKTGPPYSHVSKVDITEVDITDAAVTGYKTFRIEF